MVSLSSFMHPIIANILSIYFVAIATTLACHVRLDPLLRKVSFSWDYDPFG